MLEASAIPTLEVVVSILALALRHTVVEITVVHILVLLIVQIHQVVHLVLVVVLEYVLLNVPA